MTPATGAHDDRLVPAERTTLNPYDCDYESFRCRTCQKQLARFVFGLVQIKCDRCKTMNYIVKAETTP